MDYAAQGGNAIVYAPRRPTENTQTSLGGTRDVIPPPGRPGVVAGDGTKAEGGSSLNMNTDQALTLFHPRPRE